MNPEFLARVEAVVAQINAGEVPEVDFNVMYQLQAQGWAEKKNFRGGACYIWKGPVAVNYEGVIVKPNQETPEVLFN